MWSCLEETCLELSSLSLLKDVLSVLFILLTILIIVSAVDRYYLNKIKILPRYHVINITAIAVYCLSLVAVLAGIIIIAKRKRKKLFYFITTVMLIISCVEIGLSVTAYIYGRNYNFQINDHVEAMLMKAIENYERDSKAKEGLDYIQTDWHCCGVGKNSLWKTIPDSCCRTDDSNIRNNCTVHYERSCMPPVAEYVREKLLGIGVINTVLSVIDVLTGFWSFIIGKRMPY